MPPVLEMSIRPAGSIKFRVINKFIIKFFSPRYKFAGKGAACPGSRESWTLGVTSHVGGQAGKYTSRHAEQRSGKWTIWS